MLISDEPLFSDQPTLRGHMPFPRQIYSKIYKISARPQQRNQWVVPDLPVVDLDQYNNNLFIPCKKNMKNMKRQTDPFGQAMKK